MEDINKERKGHNKSWLQRVAEQSWEPELLISGLAVYATLQLPEYVREAFQYYQYNFQVDVGIIDELLPVLAVSVFLSALQILSFAFIFHFVVRAFWVGLVGLNSVFIDGIKYEKLNYSEIYKSEVKKRIGDKDSFILKTDRLASLVFSVAFLLVCYMFGIGVLYFSFFLLMNVVKALVSESFFELYSKVIMISGIIIIFSISIISLVLNLKRFRENERLAKIHFKFTWYIGMVFFPFISKPIQYLLLTFMSNIPGKKMQLSGIIFALVFFGMLLISMLNLLNVNMFESRNHFTERSTEEVYNSMFYDSEYERGYLINPVIQSPFLETNEYVSLFIPYSKMLDIKLNGFCDYEELDDSLKRFQQRAISNQRRIECANNFFTFLVNETDTIPADLMFTKHPKNEQPGYRSLFLLPDSLSRGKHILNIQRAIIDKRDIERDSLGRSLTFEANIPFWVQ